MLLIISFFLHQSRVGMEGVVEQWGMVVAVEHLHWTHHPSDEGVPMQDPRQLHTATQTIDFTYWEHCWLCRGHLRSWRVVNS